MTRWDVLRTETMSHAYGVEEFRVRRFIAKGSIKPEDCIRKSGESEWIKVADLPSDVWKDPLPTQDELQKARDEREKKKSASASGAKTRPVEEPPPIVRKAPDRPDAFAETIAFEISLPHLNPKDAITADQGFELNALLNEPEEESRPPRLVPPPLRKKVSKEEEENDSFSLRSRREQEELDLTSLVDVTFLLIPFFMVTATYTLQKSLEIPKPSADNPATQAASINDLRDKNIILEVRGDDSVLLDDREVPMEELVDLLRREVHQTGLNEVVIKASGGAHHEAVVAAFDAANSVGVQRIRLATTEESSDASGE